MTTQEKIAKHLGVEINEPFVVSGWNHKPFHVDPNLGVVTHDGDKVSNVMLQEILFGDCFIVNIEKKKYTLPTMKYKVRDCFLKSEILKICNELTNINYNAKYKEEIIEYTNSIVNKNKDKLEYFWQYESTFDYLIAIGYEDFNECDTLQSYFYETIFYDIVEQLSNNVHTIMYNMLVWHIHNNGIGTTKDVSKIINIAEEVVLYIPNSGTPQQVIEEFERRIKL